MRPVYIVQHVAAEGPGSIAAALDARGVPRRRIAVFEGDAVPTEIPEAGGLVVMGGPMGVRDAAHLPWMRRELALLRWALNHDVPVLGVCLGSQLLAAAAGASVTRGPALEIGWHEVALRPAHASDPLFAGLPDRFVAFHWHGDVFDLPPGAVGLARSATTPHQAFRLGARAWGLLFHLEVDARAVHAMLDSFPEDVAASGQRPVDIAEAASVHLTTMRPLAAAVFGAWAALLPRE